MRASVGVMLCLLSVGCSRGPDTGRVKGSVTFQGQPVSEGTLLFFNPDKGFGVEAQLGENGGYEAPENSSGIEVGAYIVTVHPPIVVDKSNPHTPPSPVEKDVGNIPKTYRTPGSTPLRFTIEKGENKFDIDMKP